MISGDHHTDLLSPEILRAGNLSVSLLKGAYLFLLISLLFIYFAVGSTETRFKIQGTKRYSVQIPPPTYPPPLTIK